LAACGVPTSGLCQHGFPVVLFEPGRQWFESIVDVVLNAFGVGSGVVAIQIFVYVHDEVVGSAIGILDSCQGSGRTGRDECFGTCEPLTWH
jgi:hypothetical protein